MPPPACDISGLKLNDYSYIDMLSPRAGKPNPTSVMYRLMGAELSEHLGRVVLFNFD